MLSDTEYGKNGASGHRAIKPVTAGNKHVIVLVIVTQDQMFSELVKVLMWNYRTVT